MLKLLYRLSGIWILIIIFLSCADNAFSQIKIAEFSDTISYRNLKINAFPLVFYFPETRFGFGTGGVLTWRFKKESADTRPSQAEFLAAYTLNKQLILAAPFELYFDEEKWKFLGEVSYYDFFYNYYGIGMDTRVEDLETYLVKLPGVQFELLRRVGSSFFAGLRFDLKNNDIREIKPGGLLDTFQPTGSNGGLLSSLGFVFHYDSRDYVFNPTSGFLIELRAVKQLPQLGSDFDHSIFFLNSRYYYALSKDHTLAFQNFIGHSIGDVPFFDMHFFATHRIGRGFNDRRFRDKSMFSMQTEYRFPLYKRLQGVGFFGYAGVANGIGALFDINYLPSGGIGLRFVLDSEERVRIRFDAGWSGESNTFILTFNESF
jgi:outer membrane protein assembly factor BamA